MNLMELKKTLSENQVFNLYIFYGEEYSVLETYIQNVQSKFQTPYKLYDNVSTLARQLSGNSLFNDDTNALFVIRDDNEFLSAEESWDSLVSRLKKKNDTLILKYNKLDQRSKFCKHFTDSIVEFQRMSPQVIEKHIIKLCSLTQQSSSTLAQICNYDYGRILLEIDKILNYAQYYDIKPEQAFRECMKTGGIYVGVDGEVFDLLNAFMEHNDIHRIQKEMDNFNRRGDSPLAFITMLHNAAKALLQIKCLNTTKDLPSLTGLTPYQVKNSLNHINNFNMKQLIHIIRTCKYCDKAIKTGIMDSSMVLDYMIVNCL